MFNKDKKEKVSISTALFGKINTLCNKLYDNVVEAYKLCPLAKEILEEMEEEKALMINEPKTQSIPAVKSTKDITPSL